MYLTLPEGEFAKKAPTAQSIQTLIKKVGQKKAKPVIAKAETRADAHAALLKKVVEPAFDATATLEAAFALLQQVEEYRLKGNALTDDAAKVANDIDAAMSNITAIPADVISIIKTPVNA